MKVSNQKRVLRRKCQGGRRSKAVRFLCESVDRETIELTNRLTRCFHEIIRMHHCNIINAPMLLLISSPSTFSRFLPLSSLCKLHNSTLSCTLSKVALILRKKDIGAWLCGCREKSENSLEKGEKMSGKHVAENFRLRCGFSPASTSHHFRLIFYSFLKKKNS